MASERRETTGHQILEGTSPNHQSLSNPTLQVGISSIRKATPKGISRNSKLRCNKEDEAVAEVFKDFVTSFEEPSNKVAFFVRGDVINPIADSSEYKPGELYMPPNLAKNIKKQNVAESPVVKKKKAKEKKQSVLESLKEEIRIQQEERKERQRLKALVAEQVKTTDPLEPFATEVDDFTDAKTNLNTTNLYLGNLNPNVSEQQLCEIFGEFGPLASVKIMWPRNDDERSRGKNCGFVAFMSRKDAERAMKHLNGKEIMNYRIKLNWGKVVQIPPHPVYIPPALVRLLLPPPPSGLPFNAQPDEADKHKLPPLGTPWNADAESKSEFDKILSNAVVRVATPTEKNLLFLIHRMVEFVVREGPVFETMIMCIEMNNPNFSFLFDTRSPAHVYYRWRLFSVLQADKPDQWRTEEFRMFKGGSMWKPPPLNPYHEGMPEELINIAATTPQIVDSEPKKGVLSDDEKEIFQDILRNLTPQRDHIADAMIYCVRHAEAAEEIVSFIAEAFSPSKAPLHRTLALLYLITDVLQNSCVKVANVSLYRKCFQAKLPSIFKDVHSAYRNIEGRIKSEEFKRRIWCCFKAWEGSAIYSTQFLVELQNIFYGIFKSDEWTLDKGPHPNTEHLDGLPLQPDNIGVPLSDDIDGVPLSDDIDGVPLSDDLDSPYVQGSERLKSKFKTSAWESVDPKTLEEQALTSSKWDLLERVDEQQYQDFEKESDNSLPEEKTDRVLFSGGVDGPSSGNSPDAEATTSMFKLSNWETVEAFTTSKSELSEQAEEIRQKQILNEDGRSKQVPKDPQKEMAQGKRDSKSAAEESNSDKRRKMLRAIEIDVMKYQDDLESGERKGKPNMTISEQVDNYRQKHLRSKTRQSASSDDSKGIQSYSLRSRGSNRRGHSQAKKYDREDRGDSVRQRDCGRSRKNKSRSRTVSSDESSESYPESGPRGSRLRRSRSRSRRSYSRHHQQESDSDRGRRCRSRSVSSENSGLLRPSNISLQSVATSPSESGTHSPGKSPKSRRRGRSSHSKRSRKRDSINSSPERHYSRRSKKTKY